MALDEATIAFLTAMAESGGKPISEMTPDEARDLGGLLRDMYGPGPQVTSVTDTPIPTPDGGSVGTRILAVENPRGVLVYYHGGGWVIGAIDEFDTLGRQLATRTNCTVVLVDYRLAPEHRYPTAADDAWTVLQWVESRRAELAGADAPLIVAGDSAGGNLGAIVAQKARDAGGPAIALQVLVYPVTDCDLDNASYRDPANQLMVSRDAMIWFWDHYATPEERLNPDASPLRAADLSGLPPAVVLTAEHDPLRDEGEAYAEKLRAAGVKVESRRFLGQMHGFFTMVNVLPGQTDGMDYVVEHVERVL
ncbi:MAG: esterase [Pseudonocardia sp.]|jgi:acetyl esterase|uniref:alpha/beta hydrolase n=1 Tax=Pseudonocardia sp. TaxID=60912 RepID=UPI00261135DA|nr:alpha/beta hydrolase [Pseudonocardia sp.]MCU1630399.1 esterase [Pseudonocardia sp.]